MNSVFTYSPIKINVKNIDLFPPAEYLTLFRRYFKNFIPSSLLPCTLCFTARRFCNLYTALLHPLHVIAIIHHVSCCIVWMSIDSYIKGFCGYVAARNCLRHAPNCPTRFLIHSPNFYRSWKKFLIVGAWVPAPNFLQYAPIYLFTFNTNFSLQFVYFLAVVVSVTSTRMGFHLIYLKS